MFYGIILTFQKGEPLATSLKPEKGGGRVWVYMRCLAEEWLEAVPFHEKRGVVLLADRRDVSGGAAPRAEPRSDRRARNTG